MSEILKTVALILLLALALIAVVYAVTQVAAMFVFVRFIWLALTI